MKFARYLIFFLLLAGCYADTAMIEYDNRKHQVRLGDNINKALPILNDIQSSVPSSWLRPAEQYLEGGKRFYIHYQRTGHTEDGLLTDDELTPYVFVDETLVAVGWAALGGPKTFGNAAAAAYNNQQRSKALLDLGNALSQPQTTYVPKGTATQCQVINTGNGNSVVRCYSY
ncbi:hypothetical protein OAY16_05620 [Candidatus Pelagibacter sp.]|nr:hypothetical protein [Candidatus Pelagibacter sp.]